jgi:hypothetical protein
VREVVQSVLGTQPYLEVLVIPKSAGPRRFLAVLRTALTRPLVDPVVAPISTTPISPSPITLVPRHKSWNPVSTTMSSPLAIDSKQEYLTKTAHLLENFVGPGAEAG